MSLTRASVVAFGLAAALALPARAADESATSLLRRAMTAPRTQSYIGEVQVLRFGQQRSEAAVYRIEHRAPNLTRRWYVAPQEFYGDSIITRGETTYSIDVKRDRIVVAKDDSIDDQIAEDDNFAILTANYTASFAPDDTFGGRPVKVVLLTNKYTGQTTMRVRVDKLSGLVLEKEIYAANGSLTEQTRLDHVRFSNSMPTAIFDVPTNMTRVNGPERALPSNDLDSVLKSAGFAARGPKYLPEGFTPVEGDVVDIKGVRTLHLLYSDGVRTVSLFQNRGNADIGFERFHPADIKIENHPGRVVEDGATTLLAWSEDGLHFTLVGELTRGELEKIASSVVP